MRGSRKHCINAKPGIYRLQNIINGKFYIGGSVNLLRRFWQHKQSKRYNSIIKKESEFYFIFGVVEYCDSEKLNEREQFYINKWNPEYNKNIYVGDAKKWWTEEDRKRLGEKLKISWIKRKAALTPEEFKRKHANARRGILHSEETKRKLSEMRKGKSKSPEWVEKFRQRRLGTKLINGKFIKTNEVS